jgi:serine/threonine protein kinase
MKPNDPTNPVSEIDPYATRVPSPESIEALELAKIQDSLKDESSKSRGVGRLEFDRGLIDCGFLGVEEFRVILEGLETEDHPSDSERLARHLVRLGKLTRYQASALFQGKGRSLLIGPYVVLDKLGSGGMGMVFKARLRQGGPDVALKLLPPSASRHPRAVLRFRREAAIMEKVNHPNVVSSHEIGQYGGVHYLVMDYVEGRDLDRVVRSGGPMKLTRAVDCVIQAARGLASAHGQGIVHRDIKPANLLLDTKGVVRVLDLGLARITEGDESVKDNASAPSLTASGIIMGTVDFLPPEQSDDSKRADHRADVYALGCTLYFLLTGKPPYSGESIMQRLLAHHQKPIPSLRDARPDVPAEVDAIYQKMMAKSPEDRPQSIGEVADALEAWRNQPTVGTKRRVFDQAQAAKSGVADLESKTEGSDRRPTEEPESYDLMTFVREQLFEPDSGETIRDPAPIPARRPKKGRKRMAPIDLLVRGLVAAAALVVLIRFSKDLFRSTTPEPPAKDAPAVVDERPQAAPLPGVEVMKPRPEPQASEVKAVAPRQVAPTGPSRLEELLRPPPPGEGSPGSLPPRPGSTPRKKDQESPRRPGSP